MLLGLLLVGGAMFTYFTSTKSDYNEVTGEQQRVGLSEEEEVAMGLHARPRMMQQHGGLWHDNAAQALVDRVGNKLVQSSAAKDMPYNYEFHLLADEDTINAFALPGGQVFITAALMRNFKTEDELAGVLGHEVGHVVARHSAEQIAKSKLWSGVTSALVMASGGGGTGNAQLAGLVNKVVNTRYGRNDEYESDMLGLRFMHRAGYDLEAAIKVMKILESTGSKGRGPEFLSTHPSPANRIQLIQDEIDRIRSGKADWQQ